MKIKNLIVTVALLLAIAAVFGAAMFGLNFITAPIIERHEAEKESGQFADILPSGSGFEELDISALGLPESVTKAYKAGNDAGYVFELSVTGYKPGLVIMCGVDADGKIAGMKHIATNDTFGKEAELNGSYNGQSLADLAPHMIGGATMTSNAYKDAVTAALTANTLLSGGKVDDSIVLEEVFKTVAPEFSNNEALEGTGNITKIFKTKNDIGFAYIVKSGDSSLLAVVNASGICKVYNAEGADVTADSADVIAEATAHAAANQKSYTDALSAKITSMYETATDIAPVEISTFNTVVCAVSFKVDGADHYGFYSRSIGFAQMDVYFVLDANGAIAKMDAKEFIFEKEYFGAFGGMDVGAYKTGFETLTSETWTGEAAVIATATKTSDAMKQSTADVFAAFKAIKGGN